MISTALIIAGCARSGTTLLYNLLSEVPSLWSLGYESKAIIEKHHHPRVKEWVSGDLVAVDLMPKSQAWMLTAFTQGAAPGSFWRKVNRIRTGLQGNSIWRGIKSQGHQDTLKGSVGAAIPQRGLDSLRGMISLRNRVLATKGRSIHLLEKTPENCLRLSFLEALFPQIKVIYLTRDGRTNINSLIEGWRQPHLFPGYQVPKPVQIPGISRGRWAFTLIPGWDDLLHQPLEEVCAWQWVRCNQAILTHEVSGRVPYLRVRYEDLINQPSSTLLKISDFINVPYQSTFGHLGGTLPKINVVSAPNADKWQNNSAVIEQVTPIMSDMMEQLGYGE